MLHGKGGGSHSVRDETERPAVPNTVFGMVACYAVPKHVLVPAVKLIWNVNVAISAYKHLSQYGLHLNGHLY